jgi:hypothetical protein
MTCKDDKFYKLVSLITPWFKEEPGVIQELAREKTIIMPLSEYRKIQQALMELTNE